MLPSTDYADLLPSYVHCTAWRDGITDAQMRSSPVDASHTDTNSTNDNLMDKLIYTDQSTCAISRGTLTTEQSAERQCSPSLPIAKCFWPQCFTWHAPFVRLASDKNHKLQDWGCLALPLGTWSINLFASDLILQKHCILISCHIESSPVSSMFAASHKHCLSLSVLGRPPHHSYLLFGPSSVPTVHWLWAALFSTHSYCLL